MRFRFIKYALPLLLFAGIFRSFMTTGWQVWIPLLIAWVLIPLAELLLPPDAQNLEATEEEMARHDRRYDWILYSIVPLQYAALFVFLHSLADPQLSFWDIAGRTWVMGLACGVFGINVGHELGHRVNKGEQILAKMLLLTSQYMHFYVEHNKGHHKRVATPDDPSSARYGEWIYHFYYRSIVFSYLSAWQIAGREVRKKGKSPFSLYNEMVLYTIIQVAFVVAIFWFFGWLAGCCYLVAAGIGILLLETVNYIEHYGLSRRSLGEGKYERAMPAHSWNSDHLIGRLLMFELSRHSDHHYLASRKYQVLRHHDESPQMPTGYPGMMLLALVPPAWFYVMNKRVSLYKP